jgi:TDG/mug DNA glycosylase family protein
VLNDLLQPNLLVVFCGTAAGHRSAAVQQYYAGRGNRFWKILATTELTSRELSPAEYVLLATFGIGLTDIAKGQSGNDSDISFKAGDRGPLREKILKYQPEFLCFNEKRAAQEFMDVKAVEFGLQTTSIGATRLFVAPSTSGAARASWDERKWWELARLVRGAIRGQYKVP